MLQAIANVYRNLLGLHKWYMTEVTHGGPDHTDITEVWRCARCGNCYQYDVQTGATFQVARKRCYVPSRFRF